MAELAANVAGERSKCTTLVETSFFCWKCGRRGTEPLKLARVYHADLCSSCANRWYRYAQNHALWREFVESEARRKYLEGRANRHDVTVEEWRDFQLAGQRIDNQLFDMAENWVKTRLTSDGEDDG
jgi:hypothetical protein